MIGTPAYMAPEQATGGAIDGRTDLYAWGVMAYELLSGAHPFASCKTALQLLAAHISETPAPLDRVAPALSPAIVEVVMHCLAKDPNDRPHSANDVVATLRRASTASGSAQRARPIRRRWTRIGTAVVIALGASAVSGWLLLPPDLRATVRTLFTRAPATLRVNRVVVSSFRNETGDPKLATLGALVADYLTEGLAQLGSLQVVDAGTATATGEVVRRIPRFLRAGEERALGEETGARVVVAGSYYREGDSILFRARVVDAETGTIRTALDPVSALASSPSVGITALRAKLVAVLRAASDEDATDLGGLSPPPSLEAYRAFQQGYQAYLRVDADSAIFLPMRRAMALDSSYGAAAVTLAYFASDRHYYALADSALAYARTMRDRLVPTELAMLDITEALARGDFPAAVDASRRTRIPQLTAQLATLGRRPRLAISALTATDPDRGLNLQIGQFYWTQLAEAYSRIGAHDRALEVIREGMRRVPRLRDLQLEVDLAAERGDVGTVRAALEAHSELGRPQLAQAVRATTLLRTLGGRDAEGRALVVAWANRFLNNVKPDTLPGWMAPTLADLLAATDRWREIPPVLDVGVAKGVADSARGIGRPVEFPLFRDELMGRRAVALIHLGRRAEALAIDAELARRDGMRWDRGRSLVSRAGIAAHLGDTDRAIDLLTRGLTEGGIRWSALTQARAVNLAVDPMFLPLRADPRYRALLDADPADIR